MTTDTITDIAAAEQGTSARGIISEVGIADIKFVSMVVDHATGKKTTERMSTTMKEMIMEISRLYARCRYGPGEDREAVIRLGSLVSSFKLDSSKRDPTE